MVLLVCTDHVQLMKPSLAFFIAQFYRTAIFFFPIWNQRGEHTLRQRGRFLKVNAREAFFCLSFFLPLLTDGGLKRKPVKLLQKGKNMVDFRLHRASLARLFETISN